MSNLTATQTIALNRMVQLSCDIEVQLDKSARAPFLAILAKARQQAIAAMDSLVLCDPANTDLVRGYQHEVRRYDDLVAWTKEIVLEGKEADRRLSAAEREDFEELLTPAMREEASLGGSPQEHDA